MVAHLVCFDRKRSNMKTFKQYLSEAANIKTAIKSAVKQDPARLGHGHTGKTAFWILSTGETVPFKEHKKALADGKAINVHSHSSASGKDDKGFETFSGGDIATLRWMIQQGAGDTLALISAKGQLHLLKGGSWSKKDERYDADTDENKTDLLKRVAAERGAKFTITKWK